MARIVHGSDSQQFKDRLAELQAASESYPYTEIAEAAEAVEKRCTVRTLDAEYAVFMIAELHNKGIKGKRFAGIEVRFNPCAQKFPNAYKGIPESTQFDVVYDGRAWKITQIFRYICDNTRCRILWTDEAKKAVIEDFSKI